MTRCYLNAQSMVSAMGSSCQAASDRLKAGKARLAVTDQFSPGVCMPLGLYSGALPEVTLPEPYWHSRNNRMALLALNQIRGAAEDVRRRFGAHRIGVVIGTSTSGISDSEAFLKQRAATGAIPKEYDYRLQEMGATAAFVAAELQLSGPVFGISTACSSGAKALASARRLLRAGVCDAVIAGGVDTLCYLTVQGFSSLEAVSQQPCNPFSVNRNGINIGEGAGLFLLSREEGPQELAGIGESSDAHHISAPDPSGAGAMRCMQAALADAGIAPEAVGYINLHGTATALNDQMEARAVAEVFGRTVPCSSTKPFTGHTLGAAGAIEVAICALALGERFIPGHAWDGQPDPGLPPLNLAVRQSEIADFEYALSNSFAFGGNNISVILRRST
ncbi:MAG: beta-ketoacyl-[acyl-carrier-protein] synthase family protein [Oceanospirillales bacterium]|uniref:3-oxoacyl-[acyl-carrier-protein] synthase-1 n=1 Tax=Marinobacterium halophilum TaxID=267374 RepID=A0A2P8F4N2_9GAMM|nr:beta-ketoacyl-[acyl-carrier-protein] synthase family protein [Marinobacterium halophilum]MBR9830449.1 beta-ketoacyl-[acyl-carrier-protein] synthase family protein [Oceanospirillales bacterium]PSL16646.1 3-oxoacyl-[acyl-carrier-protein] synthase-1 [Marinobacterium halophilum]